MLYGTARITAIDADGKSFVADTQKNDLWFFPSGIPHSIQGLNPDGCEFMLVFDDGEFSESETVLLSDAMAHLPPAVLSKNFGVSEQALRDLPRQELFIFQTDVPGALEADQKAAAGSLGKSPKVCVGYLVAHIQVFIFLIERRLPHQVSLSLGSSLLVS
jgi:oxalate decarboxylase